MRDSVKKSGLCEKVKNKPSDMKSKTDPKEAKKNGFRKKKSRVYTVNKSNIVEDQDGIGRDAVSWGMSYSQALQYSQKKLTKDVLRKTIDKKKTSKEVSVIGDNVESMSSILSGNNSNKINMKSTQRISLNGYSVFCLVNDDKKLEGVVIAIPDRLFDGYFFVSDKSALCFTSTYAKDAFLIQDTIIATRNKLRILNNGEGSVQYITGKTGYPSVSQRRMLCQYLADAVKQNCGNMTTQKLVAHVFRNEKRLLSDQISDFVSKGLYLSENVNMFSENKEESELTKTESSMGNRFYDSGVLMEGTKEKAKLVLYPPDKAMKQYCVPQYVETICTGAFRKANRLEAIKLGNNIKCIEKEAFVDNTSLVSVTIPKNVDVVEDGAFTRCNNLFIAFVSSKSSNVSCELFVDCRRLGSLVTKNELLRNKIDKIRASSKSKIELKVHKEDKVSDYPFLNHKDKIVVMGNIYNCLTKGHKIKTLWVNVPIKENGKYKAAPICVFHCSKCKRKFILPDVYEYYLMRYDFVNTKVFVPIEYSPWYTGFRMGLTDISGLQPRGVLKEIGYSVSELEGLSSASRINILKSVIEFGILTKAEVEQYLEFFINYIGAQDKMRSACLKWKADLNVIHNMHFNKVRYSGS